MAHWVTLKSGEQFCLMMDHDKIKKLMNKYQVFDSERKMHVFRLDDYKLALDKMLRKAASQYGEVVSVQSLPYPAEPMKHEKKGTPCHDWALCYSPRECAGRTSCPKSRACSE